MAAVIQRPLRGSRISTFYPVKNLPSLASLDSAFQLQEYISLLIRYDVHDVERIVSLPGSSKERDYESEEKDGERNDVNVDEACWIYEQLRRLAQDLSHPLITTLQQECTRASCPEMKAGEWLYLCVAHGNDGAMEQCCAIDYILHTLDSATALLNAPRTFPSRLQIPQTSHRHFSSLARRLGRIFAHAYFHHREAFEQAEAESSLYARFLALTSKFDLVPSEFLVIPASHYDNSDEDVPRGYADSRDHYQPQLREEDHRRLLRQQEADAAANSPPRGEGSGSSNGGIGESPAAAKARQTRPRTDTMILSDADANALADELAARHAEAEYDHEKEAPATARPGSESESEFEEIVHGESAEQKSYADAVREEVDSAPEASAEPEPVVLEHPVAEEEQVAETPESAVSPGEESMSAVEAPPAPAPDAHPEPEEERAPEAEAPPPPEVETISEETRESVDAPASDDAVSEPAPAPIAAAAAPVQIEEATPPVETVEAVAITQEAPAVPTTDAAAPVPAADSEDTIADTPKPEDVPLPGATDAEEDNAGAVAVGSKEEAELKTASPSLA